MEQLHLFPPPEPKRRRNQRGAELVEFALVFPVLMLFVVAALSLLWLGFIKVAAAQTAKEAARDASVPVACQGSLGAPLVDMPTVPTVPGAPSTTLPDVVVKTIETVPKVAPPDTTPTVPAPPGTALGAEVRPQLKLASATQQITVPTLPTTTLPVTVPTLPVTIPPTTLPVTIPPTTLPVTIPTVPATTVPQITVPTTPPGQQCSANFHTYPRWDQFDKKVNGRVPFFGIGKQELDVIYEYNDPNCPGGLHSPPDNSVTRCATPAPNDPPSNTKVSVTVTKQLTGPLGVFAGIFNGGSTINAHSGGGTRGE